MSEELKTVEPETPETEKKSGAKEMISPAKWAEIEHAWAHGKYASTAEMSNFFGIGRAKIENRLSQRGIKKGQALDEYNKKVQEELDKQATADATLLAKRVKETRDVHYRMSTAMAGFAVEEVVKAREAGRLQDAKGPLSSIESAMKILKMAREERFAVLGLDRENTEDEEDQLPELVVNELTQDQMEEMKQRPVQVEPEDEEIIDLAEELELGEDE